MLTQVIHKNIIVYQHQNPGAHWKIVPPGGPLLYGSQKGADQDREGEDCHWLVWGQLSKGDGQGSCCQDVWQTLDGPH